MHTWLITGTPWLRRVLGGVFLFAAVSKIRDSGKFAAAIDALGVESPAFRTTLKIVVPLAEAGLGIWLWTGWNPLYAGVTALALLVLLTVALINLRRKGYRGTCGCFPGDAGAVGAAQIGRNASLVVLALWLLLAASIDPSPSGSAAPPLDELALLAGMAGVLAPGAYILRRREARSPLGGKGDSTSSTEPRREAPPPGGGILESSGRPTFEPRPQQNRLEGPGEASVPAREVAPRMEWTDLGGERVEVGRPQGDAQLVVFANGRCPGCRQDREHLNRLSPRPRAFEAIIVCGGDLEKAKEFASHVRPPVRVVADPHWRTALAWRVPETPFSVLVDHHGHVRARGTLLSTLSLLETDAQSRRPHNESLA